jgi:hypothetical protein
LEKDRWKKEETYLCRIQKIDRKEENNDQKDKTGCRRRRERFG